MNLFDAVCFERLKMKWNINYAKVKLQDERVGDGDG